MPAIATALGFASADPLAYDADGSFGGKFGGDTIAKYGGSGSMIPQ